MEETTAPPLKKKYQSTWDNTDTFSSPGSFQGKLQRAIYELLKGPKHAGAGALPTSVRFLYYELVQAGVIPKKYTDKKRTPDQDVSLALTHLRMVGLIPWDWIKDETRSLTRWRSGPNMYRYLEDQVPYARLDCWAGQTPPMILTESRSLAGVLEGLASEYLCPIAATNGQVGGFLHTDLIPAKREGDRVLYLGDLDPQGADIEANTRAVIEEKVGSLDWERIALTAEQVEQYALQGQEKTDGRTGITSTAYETEALSQIVIQDLLRERLDDLLPEPIETMRRREARERVKILKVLRRAS